MIVVLSKHTDFASSYLGPRFGDLFRSSTFMSEFSHHQLESLESVLLDLNWSLCIVIPESNSSSPFNRVIGFSSVSVSEDPNCGSFEALAVILLLQSCCHDRTHCDAFIMRHMYIQVSKREIIFFLCSFKPNLVIFVCFRMGFMFFFRKRFRFEDMCQARGGNS